MCEVAQSPFKITCQRKDRQDKKKTQHYYNDFHKLSPWNFFKSIFSHKDKLTRLIINTSGNILKQNTKLAHGKVM